MENKIHVKRVIQRCGCDAILPMALVYVMYIILHGHLSPGGGFQGGVLMTAVVILMYLGHGYETTTRALSFNLLHGAEGFMSAVYVALALLGIAVGAQFCQNVLYTYGNAGQLYSSGTVLLMNITVGLKVIAGIGSLSLLMISVVNDRDIDQKE